MCRRGSCPSNDLVEIVLLLVLGVVADVSEAVAPDSLDLPRRVSFQMKRALHSCLLASVSDTLDSMFDHRLQCRPGNKRKNVAGAMYGLPIT